MQNLLCVLLVVMFAPAISEARERNRPPAVQLEYVTPENSALIELFEGLKEEKFLEAMAEGIQQRFRIPRNVTLVLGQCDEANAYYYPEATSIVTCLELFPFLVQNLLKDRRLRRDEATAELVLGGAIAFVAMHEVGHAVIDIYRLPVLGREEDAADQISVYLLLTDPDVETQQYGIAGGLWFFRTSRSPFTIQHLSGEHGLAQQRQANIACWAYGSDPVAFAWALDAGRVTNERAARCSAEFQQLKRSVEQLLGSSLLRPSTLKR